MEPGPRLLAPSTVSFVQSAVLEAQAQHGPLTHDPVRVLAIITEELGEVAAEVLGMTRERNDLDTRTECQRRAVKELTQVAAVVCLMIENLNPQTGDIPQ